MSDATIKADADKLKADIHAADPGMPNDTYQLPKPGWFTSEAHMTLLTNILGAASVVLGAYQQQAWAQVALIGVGALASILSTLGYTKSRTAIKTN